MPIKRISSKNRNKRKAFNKKSNIHFFSESIEENDVFQKAVDKITGKGKKLPELKDFNFPYENPSLHYSLDSVTPLHLYDLLFLNKSPEIVSLQYQFCNKTGKLLRARTMEELSSALNVLSEDKIIAHLQRQFGDNYAIEWLDTSPESLHKLSKADPLGYFIYSASLLFHYTHTVTDNKPLEMETRNLFVQDKSEAYKNLVFLVNKTDKAEALPITEYLIIECNELMRRLLGLIKPANLAKFARFNVQTLFSLTGDVEALEEFRESLAETIKHLMELHFKSISAKRQARRQKHIQIKYQDLIDIKKQYGGLSNFHQQPKLKKCSKKESILFDMLDFLDIEEHENGYLAEEDLAGLSNFDDLDNTDKTDNLEGLEGFTDSTAEFDAEVSAAFKDFTADLDMKTTKTPLICHQDSHAKDEVVALQSLVINTAVIDIVQTQNALSPSDTDKKIKNKGFRLKLK